MKIETDYYYENGIEVVFETDDVISNSTELLEEVIERYQEEIWRGEYNNNEYGLSNALEIIWLLNEVKYYIKKEDNNENNSN